MTITTTLGMIGSVSFVLAISAAGIACFGSWAYSVLRDMI